MAKKVCAAVMVVAVLALIGLVAADLYVSGQIETTIAALGSEAEELVESWKELQAERLSTAFFAGIVFVIMGFLVLKIGPERKQPGKISQKKALKVADELMKQYQENGVYVEAREDDPAEDVITEMEMPKIKEVRFEGDKVVVEWNKVSKATGYYVWRQKEKEDWCKVKKFKKPVYRYEDRDIEPQTHYAYAIRSVYEADGVRIISPRDPMGTDLYVAAVRRAEKESQEAER